MQPARAESISTLSETQLTQVRANCTIIKNSLNQLHASDALMRVNRGQLYEAIGSKLMSNFASRVANNNLNNSSLLATSQDYQSQLAGFRNDYILYEKALSTAIGTSCTEDTANFVSNIDKARQLRMTIRSDVENLNNLIGNYYDKFTAVKKLIVSGSGANQ